MKNCNCGSDINRDGSGQLQRYLKALDPTYAPIDDRSTEDLLVYAKRYAAQIRFYDIPESKINDGIAVKRISWREFFRRDMAVIAASVAVTDAKNFKKEYDEVNERLQLHPKPEIYAALYAPIIGMLKKIDRWLSVAIPENPLYADLKLAIDSDLKQQVQKIMAYEEGFMFVDPAFDLKLGLDGVENKEIWGLTETVPSDATIYKGTTPEEKIISASLFTEDIFHAFYNFLNKLIADSEKYFQFAMEQYPAHQPHMALFITFLQLFNKAQQQMNGLTGKMLDFYYKEVLHLETKSSVPDKAHIVFELAKDVTEYDVAAGTALKAGPDKSGKEQFYKTTGDLVVNQARVKELKTIFVEKVQKGATAASETIQSIYARPVANSYDGFGKKFEGTDIKWPTFGIGNPEKPKPTNPCERIDQIKALAKRTDQAKIGFSIASPQLLMQGGKRLIEIKLNATAAALFTKQQQMTTANNDNLFEIWFTGDKEWFKVDRVMTAADEVRFKKFLPVNTFNPTTSDIEASYYLVKETNSLFVYLPLASPPVIAYSSKLHTAFAYTTTQPVMQVMLNPELDLKSADYKNLSADNLSLHVKVGSVLPNAAKFTQHLEQLKANDIDVTQDERNAFDRFPLDGLSKLVLQNESAGVLPVGKPFDPFTAYPNKGKSFYVGSNEVFNKPLQQMAVFIKKTEDDSELAESPTNEKNIKSFSNADADFALSILENRGWVSLKTYTGNNFFQVTLKSNTLNLIHKNPGFLDNQPATDLFIHPRLPILPVTEWKPDTEKGFIRLTYLQEVDGGQNFLQASQNLAPTLEIKEVSVSYKSDLAALQVGVDEFYHVYPFGITETYVGAVAQGAQALATASGIDTMKENSITKIRSFLGANAFAKADELKDYLLVNANNALLPQFTYLSPYDQYKPSAKLPAPAAAKATEEATATGIKAGMLMRKSALKKDGDAIASRLMLNASGLADIISGGANQYSGTVQEEGMLLIGLEKAQPLQMVSMLLQFAEGSAEDEDNDSPEIHWSYLTNNEWRPLKEESIVSDGTVGFQTTGIIKVEIPEDATNNNTIVTSGLYWLCASVTSNSNRIPMLIDVVTQAVLASFEDNSNDQSHFDTALAAGSISKLSVAAAQVSKVQQPFASFDGKHQEIGKEFYTRASERLRHKARAITPWDYEHLVLDQFPSIYKVKCLTHTDSNCLCTENEVIIDPDRNVLVKYNASGGFDNLEEAKILTILTNPKTIKILITILNNAGNTALAAATGGQLKQRFSAAGFDASLILSAGINPGIAPFTMVIKLLGNSRTQKNCCGPQIAPGHVLLIPISNLKNRNAVNPLQPKTSRRVLLDIEAYLQKRVSPFVQVHAKNPVYEQVLVFFRVKFREGFDKGFHLKKLNDEIVHYLTPWAFDDITEVKFGQKIYASSIINFIEERNYVDFITDFLMVVCRKGCCEEIIDEGEAYDEKDILDKITGCSDMEVLLQDDKDYMGDIIAKPSTARSLLVSAPKHIIIPYQEPEVISPCQGLKTRSAEKTLLSGKEKLKEIIATRDTPAEKITPVPMVAATEAEVSIPQPVVTVVKEVATPAPVAALAETVKNADKPKAVKKPVVKKSAVKKEPVKPVKKTVKAPKKK